MKNMQEFHKWLSAGQTTSLQQRLAALTQLSRERMCVIAAFDPWYIWDEEVAAVS